MKQFFKRLAKFFYDVRVELKKVHWPSRREIALYTGIVLVTVVVIGFFFWGLDNLFISILQLIIRA
ncbi:MAG TPA: preprotein translocase subunit SecE [Firmicutes bacterium]|nr:preprotein translocase subunit SecE [Bacillota bacterium]